MRVSLRRLAALTGLILLLGLLLAVVLLLVIHGSRGPTARPTPLPTEPSITTLHVYPAESQVGFTAKALGGSLEVEGSYAILGGYVTLTPEDGQLRIRAYLDIDTPSITVHNAVLDEVLRLGMEADAYPVAIFDATSTTLVPVTEEEVAFTLEGTLTLHGQTRPVTMTVDPATVIDNHLRSASRMTLDLAAYGISLPEAMVDSTIELDVHLVADETPPPTPTAPSED